MDKAELGRRIKEARLAKKMTQAEVVGSFITRNMLSQIESGTAAPSVNTLEYLSRVLEIPLDTLMPGDSDAQETDSAAALANVKRLYLGGRYAEVTALEQNCGVPEDELWAIKAKSYLALAGQISENASGDELRTAAEYAKTAAELSDKGIYSNSAVKTEAMLLLNDLAKRLSEYYESLMLSG